MTGIVSMLTDFGIRDPYVGIMKAVVLSVAPQVRIVDISHDVRPQDIRQGAYLLKTAYRWFPRGSVHLAVVDPGVGTSRKAVAFRAGGWMFIGPDNGLFTYPLKTETVEEAVSITNPDVMIKDVSETFHGRDIFAPAAAFVVSGAPLSELGPSVDSLAAFASLEPRERDDGGLDASILHVDRFGNCITSVERNHVEGRTGLKVEVADTKITGLARTYQDAAAGQPIALFGSSGHLEIAVNFGSAATQLNISIGDSVIVRPV